VDHGVHAFIVPLRDEAGRCLPGVEIHDCGYKVCVFVWYVWIGARVVATRALQASLIHYTSHLLITQPRTRKHPSPLLQIISSLQVGLNGVDNGAIRFRHVRVPRANLLDRFASVDKSGRYSSPLTSEVCACG
jgi:hypothetical protein